MSHSKHPSFHILLYAVLICCCACGSHKKTSVHPTPQYPTTHTTTATTDSPIVSEARKWIGVPYKWGGSDSLGFDCSGFVMRVYLNATGRALPRTTAQQREWCEPVEDAMLQEGDILFFSSDSSKGKTAHTGIYSAPGLMIHASSSRGVIESSLATPYWTRNYLGAGRPPRNN